MSLRLVFVTRHLTTTFTTSPDQWHAALNFLHPHPACQPCSFISSASDAIFSSWTKWNFLGSIFNLSPPSAPPSPGPTSGFSTFTSLQTHTQSLQNQSSGTSAGSLLPDFSSPHFHTKAAMNSITEPVPRSASPYIDPNVQGPRAQLLASGIQTDLRKSTSCRQTRILLPSCRLTSH